MRKEKRSNTDTSPTARAFKFYVLQSILIYGITCSNFSSK